MDNYQEFISRLVDLVNPLKEELSRLCPNDESTVSDIVHDTFLKAVLHKDQYREDKDLRSWLRRIAVNAFLDGYYKSITVQLNENMHDRPDESADVEGNFEAKEKLQKFYRALDSLGGKEREVMILRFMEGRSVKDIAGITGAPDGTVKSLLSRGMRKIRIIMDEYYGY